jgi:hypothetical protein
MRPYRDWTWFVVLVCVLGAIGGIIGGAMSGFVSFGEIALGFTDPHDKGPGALGLTWELVKTVVCLSGGAFVGAYVGQFVARFLPR